MITDTNQLDLRILYSFVVIKNLENKRQKTLVHWCKHHNFQTLTQNE